MKYKISAIYLLITIFSVHLNAQNTEPERWEETIREFEMRDKNDPPEKGAVLFTGSSSIAMWQDIADYFPENKIINRGFGGSEFSDLIHYSNRVIYPYKPSKIFIYEGDNDLAAGESIESILSEAKMLREEIAQKLPNTPVVFISPKPSMSRWGLKEKYEELNKSLKKYAEETERTEFADVWTAMLDSNGQVLQEVFLEDGLHMKPSGYEIWKSVLEPYMPNQ